MRKFFLRMMSDVFRCSIDVFRCSQLFSDVFRMSSIDHKYSTDYSIYSIFYIFSDVLNMSSDVLGCSQMFSDDHRFFWIFSRHYIDVPLMFSRCSLDVLRMFGGFF